MAKQKERLLKCPHCPNTVTLYDPDSTATCSNETWHCKNSYKMVEVEFKKVPPRGNR